MTACLDDSEPHLADGRKRVSARPARSALLARIAPNVSTAQLRKPADIDRQQQRMKQQHRRETSEIGVCDESHIARDGEPAQRAHRTHAECAKHETGSAKAYCVDDGEVAHAIVLLAELSSANAWGVLTLALAARVARND